MFHPPKYELVLLRRYERQPVRQLAFNVESIFRSYINAEVNVANLPANAPPPAPRFQMSDGKRSLMGSETAMQLTMDFGAGAPKGSSWASVLEKPAALMDQVDNLMPDTLGFKAVVLQASRSFEGDQDVVAALIAKLFGEKMAGHPVGAGYTYATKSGDLVTNLEISQFKFFEWTMVTQDPASAAFGVDIDFVDPQGEGLQVKLDINNKARGRRVSDGRLSDIVLSLDEAFDETIVQHLMKVVV